MGISSIERMEQAERVTGRHAVLISQAEDLVDQLLRIGETPNAAVVRQLLDVVARQEIELRQAIADKRRQAVSLIR